MEAVRWRTGGAEILADRYNLITALVGGLFLFLGYFGADQSQVQRFLSSRSAAAGRRSLLLSAYAKVPLQLGILLLGVLIFVQSVFEETELSYRLSEAERAAAATGIDEWDSWQQQLKTLSQQRASVARDWVAAMREERAEREFLLEYQSFDQQIQALRAAAQTELEKGRPTRTRYGLMYFRGFLLLKSLVACLG